MKELQHPQSRESVHKVEANVRVTCFRCGKRGHLATSCKFNAESCYKCGKIGHTRSVCRSKVNKTPKPKKEVKLQEEEIETEDDYTLFQLGHGSSNEPIVVHMDDEGKEVSMEVDTGSALSLISEEVFKSLHIQKALLPTNVVLSTYTGEKIKAK